MRIKQINGLQSSEIIETRKPKGLFYVVEPDNSFTGIDNSTGDAWTENFEAEEECMSWLRREEDC